MRTSGKLRGVEDQLTKDLRETTLSFQRLGEKYGVSKPAIFLFCHTKGITRLTSSKKQKPVHSERKCQICQRLIGISKKSNRDLIYYETLKEHLGFQGVELPSHLTFLRSKGLVPRKFGRQHFKKTQKRRLKRDKMDKQLLRNVHEKDELTPFEALRILGISHSTLHRYCAEGILEYRQHPITKWRSIKRRSVEELLKRYGLL